MEVGAAAVPLPPTEDAINVAPVPRERLLPYVGGCTLPLILVEREPDPREPRVSAIDVRGQRGLRSSGAGWKGPMKGVPGKR